MKDLMKMLAEKDDSMEGQGELSPEMIQAKIDVLQELLQEATMSTEQSMMDGMQKVEVMAPDEQGLEEGLEMAEKVVGGDIPMVSKEDLDEDEEDEDY